MNRLLPQSTLDARKRRRRSTDVATSVKLPRMLGIALKREAEKQQRSQSWIMREAIQSYISFRQADAKIGRAQFEADKRRAAEKCE